MSMVDSDKLGIIEKKKISITIAIHRVHAKSPTTDMDILYIFSKSSSADCGTL